MIETIIAAGFANWIATTILVESELTRPLRDLVRRLGEKRVEMLVPEEVRQEVERTVPGLVVPEIATTVRPRPVFGKLAYLVQCHLCTGTWVGFAEAGVTGAVLGHGWMGVVLTGLVFKGVGHFVLETVATLRSVRGESA